MEHKRDKMEGQKQLMSQVAEDVKHLWENMRREKGKIKYLKKKVRPDMQRVIFEPDEIRKMLHTIQEDTKLCKKHFFEEKTQMKWMSFQAEKRKKKLDQKLEKIIQEGDQLDILKKKIDQQRQETKKKWKEILTLILISEKIKINLEKSTEEIRSTNAEMLKTQQKIKKSNEVKTYMDKLACIKNQINKWKLTQPPVTSGLLKEKLEGTQTEVRSEILTDIEKNSGAEKNPLENIRISEGYVTEEKTDIHEKFLKHSSERESFPQEIQALEKQIYELNEQEKVLKVQIKTNIRKLQDKTQKMRSIVTELDEIQCQKTDAEVIIREMGTIESKLLQEVQQRDYLMQRTNVFRKQIMQTDLEDQTKTTIVELKPDMKSLEKWKEDPQALAKETQVCSDGKYLRLTDLQRLRAEIYQTQQIMELIKPEIGCQVRTGNETKDLVDNEIKELLQDLRQFQKLLETEVGKKKHNLNVDTCIQKSTMKKKRRELDHKLENILRERDELEMLKTKIQRKSEGTQQQLEKIRKCQNDIEKIAGKAKESSKVIMYNMNKSDTKVRIIEDLNKKIEASKQRWNEIYLLTSQHKALTEKLKTELGHENERESLFERENIKRSEKLERDKSFTSKKTTQAEETFEEFLVLTPHQERLIINQFIYRKCNGEEQNLELSETVIQEILRKVNEMLAQETGAEGQNGKLSQMKIEHNKKAFLGETNERQKQHMTEGQDIIKWTREIGEMEEIKSKGNKAMLKQLVKEGEKNEKMMNEIKEANISFKREVQRRRRELDQRLEKITREKDELEMLKLKLRQPKAAMFHDNQKAQDQRTVVCVLTENEPKDVERNWWKITNTQYETVPKSPGLGDTINNVRDLSVKIYGYLETLKNEICLILKHQNVEIHKKRDEITALTAENNTVKENIARLKSLIGMDKMTKQGDVDETWKLRKDTHKQEFRIKSLTTEQKAKKRKVLMTEMVTAETKQQKQKKRKNEKDPFGEIDKKKTDNLEKHVKTQMETVQVLMKKIKFKNKNKGIELHKIQDTHKSFSNMGRQLEDNSVKLVNVIDIIKNIKERILKDDNQLTATGKDKVEKPKTEIIQEIEEPKSSLEETNKEKIKLDMQAQRAILQQEKQDIQEERKRINITKTELDQKTEEASSCLADINKKKIKLAHLSVSVQRNHERLQDIINTIALKQQGRERKDQLFQTQTQELQSKRVQLQKEKEEMQLLMSTVNKMREWIKAAIINTQKEKQQVDYIKMHKHKENMVSIQNIELERERPGLTPREDSDLDKSQMTERRQGQIQHIREKLSKNIKVKMVQLQQRIAGVENLSVGLGQKLLSLIEQKENVAGYKEVFEREKGILNSLLCDTLKQREDMENRWKQTMNLEKEKVTSLEATLKKEKQDLELEKQKMLKDELVLEMIRNDIQKQSEILQQDKQDIQTQKQELESTMMVLHKKMEETKNLFDEINKEKSKLKDLNRRLKTQGDKLKVLMNAISSKPQEQEGKGPEILTQTQNLELCRKKLQKKRQELEILMKNSNSMKEKVKDSMNSVHEDIEQMISMKKNIEIDREKLSSEMKRLVRELSECKMRQDKLSDVMKSTENLRITLQGVKDKMCGLTNVKMRRLYKGHEDAQLLCISLEKNVSAIGYQMKTPTPYKEVVEREKISLTSIISSMRNQRELMEHQWKQMLDRDKKDLNKMKEELKRETQNLERVADKVDKEKEHLDVMMSDIQAQRAILQQEKQDIQEERKRINITKTELDQKTEDAPMKNDIFSAFTERLRHVNLMTVELFQNSIVWLDGKSEDLDHFLSSFQASSEFHLIRGRISYHLNWIKQQRQHFNQTMCDKATQTVSMSDQSVETYKQNVNPFKIGTPEIKFQNLNPLETEFHLSFKEDDDLKTLSKFISFNREWQETALKDYSDVENRKKTATSPRVSSRTEDYTKHPKSNSLQRSWKDTRMEFKEINLMKHRGQEIKNNLDKRLNEIIHFGKITLKEKLIDNSLPEKGTCTSTQGNFDSSTKTANIKYVELQQLKFHMLSQIERLQLKENTSETFVSYEKDDQTFQKEIIPAKEQEMQEQDKARGGENEAATSSRLLCLLQHYCCRCCCHCRKHVRSKKMES